MSSSVQYEPVIGLEIHAQLSTSSKLFCGDSTSFGDEPNSHVGVISLAHPGTLPMLNKEAVTLAIRLGVALECEITRENYFARKNYFYPDLPKGYQISQHTHPICRGGRVPIMLEGKEQFVLLNRIHLEEDAGKSVHDIAEDATCIDLNRAGVPLVEMVTEPCIHSAEEAFTFISAVRKMVRFLDVCDGNMEEGSLRCDANISLRRAGDRILGTRVEVKNLNSIRNVKRAIEFEISRLTGILDSGEKVVQQTRSFDADSGTTFALRSKEEANDYRYFPEPDLAPLSITEEMLKDTRKHIPELPYIMEKRLVREMGLSEQSALVICDERYTMELFNEVAAHTRCFQAAANWIIGPVKAFRNEHGGQTPAVKPTFLAALADLTESGKLSFASASAKIFPMLAEGSEESPLELAEKMNLLQEKDEDKLREWVNEVLEDLPGRVQEYKQGKKNLIGLFAGQVKKKSKGSADMRKVQSLLSEILNQQ